MKSTNFNLRGISSEVMSLLKTEAKKKDASVNLLILQLIDQGIGHSHSIRHTTYHDLDKLAGTWSDKDEKDFKNNTHYFEKIDKDLWL